MKFRCGHTDVRFLYEIPSNIVRMWRIKYFDIYLGKYKIASDRWQKRVISCRDCGGIAQGWHRQGSQDRAREIYPAPYISIEKLTHAQRLEFDLWEEVYDNSDKNYKVEWSMPNYFERRREIQRNKRNSAARRRRKLKGQKWKTLRIKVAKQPQPIKDTLILRA